MAALVPTVPEALVVEHTHAEAHFVLVLEGLYVSSAVGAPPVGGPGLLVYNPPGTTHRDRFRGDGGRFLTISVPSGALHEVRDAVSLPDHAVVPGARARRRARWLARRFRPDGGAAALELETFGVELLDLVAAERRALDGGAPGWLARARALLSDELTIDHSLGDVARVVGVHPVYLTRAFRRYYRSTPGDFLRRRRLIRAAALLANGADPLAEIGAACGFCDQAHFSHSFKRAFGESPGAYRARHAARRRSASSR